MLNLISEFFHGGDLFFVETGHFSILRGVPVKFWGEWKMPFAAYMIMCEDRFGSRLRGTNHGHVQPADLQDVNDVHMLLEKGGGLQLLVSWLSIVSEISFVARNYGGGRRW